MKRRDKWEKGREREDATEREEKGGRGRKGKEREGEMERIE